jgi:ribosome maturation factor RimP
METVERIRLLVAPLLAEAEVELYDLEYTGGILKVTIDRPGGVDVGTVGSVTREVSRALDEADPIAGAFTLEVSSPGLERALRTPEHFARSVGETILVKARAGVEGDRRLKGKVLSADAHGITIDPAEPPAGPPRSLAYDEIERARTVFEWGPAPKPGARTTNRSTEKKAAGS